MDEQKLKDIKAPEKGVITEKQRRINTYIFTVVGSIFNLAITVVIVFALLLGGIYFTNRFFPTTEANFETRKNIILWGSVVIGIISSFLIQQGLTKLIIKLFHLEQKLQDSFVERYCGKKE